MRRCPDDRFSRLWLVSFGDSRLVKPRRRLMRQALEFGLLEDHIIIKNEEDLDSSFREEMKERLILGSRGYGYWCWKPEVCLEAFRLMQNGDVLLFLDIGCHLRTSGRMRFLDYLRTAEETGSCGFQARSLSDFAISDFSEHVYINATLTKGDVFDYFRVRDDPRFTKSGQIEASAFFLKKSAETENFLFRWLQVFRDDFALMDDTPSKSPNLPGFTENRHDQSALTILWLKNHFSTFSACEIEPLAKYAKGLTGVRFDPVWGASWFWRMAQYPIQARRDKGTLSFYQKMRRFIRQRFI